MDDAIEVLFVSFGLKHVPKLEICLARQSQLPFDIKDFFCETLKEKACLKDDENWTLLANLYLAYGHFPPNLFQLYFEI